MLRSRGVALVALVAAASLGGWWLGRARMDEVAARVVAVVDGDTVEVVRSRGPDLVRLVGVDTPETVHPDRPVECFGPEASAFTRDALLGRTVRLEFDTERRDHYGRLLAYVVVDGERFNDRLLREGYARLLLIPPNTRHGWEQLEAQFEARRHRRGLWVACGGS